MKDLYDKHVLPHLIDLACGMKAVVRERKKIIPKAYGQVLEVGIGTGLNLPWYDQANITKLYGLDPAVQMNSKAKARSTEAGLAVELVPLSAETIPVGDGFYDTVVSTYTLCSIPDVASALKEMYRVLKPGGLFLFSEHGSSPDPKVHRMQVALTPMWKVIAGGCHLDRDALALIREAGFEVADMEQRYLKGPRIMTWVTTGHAYKPL